MKEFHIITSNKYNVDIFNKFTISVTVQENFLFILKKLKKRGDKKRIPCNLQSIVDENAIFNFS